MKNKSSESSETVKIDELIRNCSCVSDFQDKRYGRNVRAHTQAQKEYRCTVCGSAKPKR